MPNGIEYRIDFDERRIVTRFVQLPVTLYGNLARVIESLGRIMYARVVAAEPDRTGKLRGQTKLFIDKRDDRISARVRVLGDATDKHNVKAAALEYGAHRLAKIAAHQAHGGALVKAYQRRTNITGVHFLHGARASIEAQAFSEIQAVVTKSVQGEVA